MGRDHCVDDRQPQPCTTAIAAAAWIGAIKRLEDSFPVIDPQAAAVVDDRQPGAAVLRRHPDLNRRRRGGVDEGVANQVTNHLSQAGVVARHDYGVRRVDRDLPLRRDHPRVGGGVASDDL